MAGSKGNTNNKKLKTPELKKLAYEDYCRWIAKGNPHKAWYFEHEDLTLSWQSMERYIREEAADFNPTYKQVAESKSLAHWSTRGSNLVDAKQCQPAIYQMMMRNIHSWDKETKEEHTQRITRESELLGKALQHLESRYKDIK